MRRKYFVGIGPQFKYLSLLIVSMTLPTVLVAAGLYFLIFRIIEEQAAHPEFIAQNLLPAIDKVNLIVIIGLPVVFLLLFIWGLLLSHRFAGPITRLIKELNEVATQSDFSRRLMVRKQDELRPLVDSINKILEKVQKT